jgi:hypothetical protein
MPEDLNFQSKEVFDIDNVEIFSAGIWNGDKYTKEDLEDMVKSFEDVGHIIKPFIKLGHNEKQQLLIDDGMPSAGWITKLKVKGEKLLADFKGIPKKIKELIDKNAYGRFSSEIYWNLQMSGKKHKRVLKAVALLGADTPAVGTLDDFINLYIENTDEIELKSYHIKEENKMAEHLIQDLQSQVKEYSDKIHAYELKEKEYTNTIDNLNADIKYLKTEIETKEKEQKTKEVKSYIDSQVKEGKVMPSLVEKYTELAMKDFESVQEILKNAPKVVPIGDGESQHIDAKAQRKYSDMTEDQKDEYLDTRVREYASKHELSYSEAYPLVLKDILEGK